MAGLGDMLTKDLGKLMGISRHVKRMQVGSPLLLRTPLPGGKEKMEICIVRISEDMTRLCWSEQLDGDGSSHEVQLSSIIDVTEEPAADAMDDEDHGSIMLTLQPDEAARKGLASSMTLCCASAEDLVTWRDGLRHFIGEGKPSTDVPESPASSTATAKRMRKTLAPTSAMPPASPSHLQLLSQALGSLAPQALGSLARPEPQVSPAASEKLRKQEDEITKLKQENRMLHETVKRKDVTIAQLMHDMQKMPSSSDLCNKTESTSRESDDHLRYRETVILKRKNQRLKQANDAKQQTITQLMQVIQSCQEKQNEFIELEDSEDLNDAADTSRKRSIEKPPVSHLSRSDPDDDDEEDDSEPEAIREEMRTLAGKLEQLERDVEELHPAGAQGLATAAGATTAGTSVSSVSAAAKAPAETAPSPSAALLAMAEAMGLGDALGLGSPAAFKPPSRAPPAESSKPAAQAFATSPAFDFSAVGGAPPTLGGNSNTSRSSPAALQALAKEMELLEEKKRVVEQLAKELEPASDGEEDGFPLR